MPEVFIIIRYYALYIIICAILFTVDCTSTIGLFTNPTVKGKQILKNVSKKSRIMEIG